MFRITINGIKYQYFSDLKLSLNYTGFVSTFSFNAPFDPDIELHRSIFKPLGYQTVKIYYNDELLLTGNIVNHKIEDQATPTNAAFSGYSKSGILQDVSIPTSLYPLQSKDRTLREIVDRLVSPFNISVKYINAYEADIKYSDTVADQGNSVGAYIHKLCEQRDLRLSHDVYGNLVISKPVYPGIFTNFTDNYRAVNSNISVDGQAMYSQLTAIRQASIGNDVQAQSSASFPITFRPLVQVQQDGEHGDIEKMAASMLSNTARAISLNLHLDRWTNYDNKIYKPGYVVGYQNSQLGIYSSVNMFIESVELYEENKLEVSNISLIPDWAIFDVEPNNPFS